MKMVNQEVLNDTAKLIMHRLIARALTRDPALVLQARVELANLAQRFPDRSFVVEWERLLGLPVDQLRTLLTRRHDQYMKRLRLSSPFMTARGVRFEEPALRRRIRRAAKRIVARSSGNADDSDSRPARV